MTADGVVHGLLIAGSVTVALSVVCLLITQAMLVARGQDPFRPLDDEWRPRQMTTERRTFDYRDTKWVAERLGVTQATVHKWLKEGRIPGLQLRKKWLVSERSLSDYIDRLHDEQAQRRPKQ